MSKKTILGVLVILVILGITVYVATRKKPTVAASTFTDFFVEKPFLVAKGANLSKVEVWAIPTGTGVTEKDYKMLGVADQTSQSASANGETEWHYAIPKDPILATEIFAKAFDKAGKEVRKISLPYIGSTLLYSELWGPVTENKTTLQVGQTYALDDTSSVKLTKIVQDSRCAADVTCIRAGDVTIELEGHVGTVKKTISVNSANTKPVEYNGYFISITSIEPLKAKAGTAIKQSDYKIELTIAKDAKL
ncbi:hypothetical protein KW783_00480 [Candidatus Parcubacteria bacterium]|nr:hypothetical protein [Candidatus Parcubacteria bacterium]